MSYWFLILVSIFCGGEDRAVDFDTEIVPVFTRYGCNAGACHGSATGRGGFKLSLFGSRPELDHRSIVNQFQGRRINQSNPERSLLLLKPTGELGHGGDHRFDFDSPAGIRISNWIKQGANRDSSRKLVRFEVIPTGATHVSIGQTVGLKSFAVFSDGVRRDVTDWTVFEAEDKRSIELNSQTSVAKPVVRGRHIVIARFLDQVASVEILVPINDALSQTAKPSFNFIDESINAKLDLLRIPVSPQASDSEFLRRIYLDLTGALPSPEEVLEFLDDDSEAKRKRLIERLMQTEGFTDYWTYRFGQWLRVGSNQQDAVSATAYYRWLRDEVKQNRPLDQLVRTLITSSGDTHQIGAANFYRTSDNARLQAEFVSQSLMGVQLRCANCHDHPFDRWTQDDYHGLSAVFATVGKGRVISIDGKGEVINPRTGEPAITKIPDVELKANQKVDLDNLAEWLTREDNAFFAKAATNRIWSNFFGRGLVDPIDDIRSTNPATHPQLLDDLAKDFQRSSYDFRHTIRLICNSAAYQRSSQTLPGNKTDDRFYSRMPMADLSPEVLADAISNVTSVSEAYNNHPEGTKAIQLHKPGIKSAMLETLGRCTDEKTCEVGLVLAGGISRQLQLINGDLLNRRISDSAGRLHQLALSGKPDKEIVAELYLRCFSRKPNESENSFWMEQLSQSRNEKSRMKVLEDFSWSLLTCREFTTNH
jgi:hypothetical protein